MSWPLPRAIAQSSGLVLQDVDYVIDDQQAKAATGGTASITWDQIEQGYLWRIERIIVTTTATVQTTASVYESYASPSKLRDSTIVPVGFSAVAEYPSFLTIPSGQQLLIVVSGGTVGDAVTASVQYRLVQRAAA